MPDPTQITLLQFLNNALPAITAIISGAIMAWLTHRYELKKVIATTKFQSYHEKQLEALILAFHAVAIAVEAMDKGVKAQIDFDRYIDQIQEHHNTFLKNSIFIQNSDLVDNIGKVMPRFIEVLELLSQFWDTGTNDRESISDQIDKLLTGDTPDLTSRIRTEISALITP